MRTIKHFSLAARSPRSTAVAGCTVKDVDTPALAGPSTFASTIVMTADSRHADRRTASSQATSDHGARTQRGSLENIPLRAQIFVDGVAQDFGTLSTKTPITPTHDSLHRAAGVDAGRRPGRPDRHDRRDADGRRRLPRRGSARRSTFA